MGGRGFWANSGKEQTVVAVKNTGGYFGVGGGKKEKRQTVGGNDIESGTVPSGSTGVAGRKAGNRLEP